MIKSSKVVLLLFYSALHFFLCRNFMRLPLIFAVKKPVIVVLIVSIYVIFMKIVKFDYVLRPRWMATMPKLRLE